MSFILRSSHNQFRPGIIFLPFDLSIDAHAQTAWLEPHGRTPNSTQPSRRGVPAGCSGKSPVQLDTNIAPDLTPACHHRAVTNEDTIERPLVLCFRQIPPNERRFHVVKKETAFVSFRDDPKAEPALRLKRKAFLGRKHRQLVGPNVERLAMRLSPKPMAVE